MADGQVIIDDNGGSRDARAWDPRNLGLNNRILIAGFELQNATAAAPLVKMDELTHGTSYAVGAKFQSVQVFVDGNPFAIPNPANTLIVNGTEWNPVGPPTNVSLTLDFAANTVTPSEPLMQTNLISIYKPNNPSCIQSINVDGTPFPIPAGAGRVTICVPYA